MASVHLPRVTERFCNYPSGTVKCVTYATPYEDNKPGWDHRQADPAPLIIPLLERPFLLHTAPHCHTTPNRARDPLHTLTTVHVTDSGGQASSHWLRGRVGTLPTWAVRTCIVGSQELEQPHSPLSHSYILFLLLNYVYNLYDLGTTVCFTVLGRGKVETSHKSDATSAHFDHIEARIRFMWFKMPRLMNVNQNVFYITAVPGFWCPDSIHPESKERTESEPFVPLTDTQTK